MFIRQNLCSGPWDIFNDVLQSAKVSTATDLAPPNLEEPLHRIWWVRAQIRAIKCPFQNILVYLCKDRSESDSAAPNLVQRDGQCHCTYDACTIQKAHVIALIVALTRQNPCSGPWDIFNDVLQCAQVSTATFSTLQHIIYISSTTARILVSKGYNESYYMCLQDGVCIVCAMALSITLYQIRRRRICGCADFNTLQHIIGYISRTTAQILANKHSEFSVLLRALDRIYCINYIISVHT